MKGKKNPIAKDLRTPKYKQRVVRDKKRFPSRVTEQIGRAAAEAMDELHPGIWDGDGGQD